MSVLHTGVGGMPEFLGSIPCYAHHMPLPAMHTCQCQGVAPAAGELHYICQQGELDWGPSCRHASTQAQLPTPGAAPGPHLPSVGHSKRCHARACACQHLLHMRCSELTAPCQKGPRSTVAIMNPSALLWHQAEPDQAVQLVQLASLRWNALCLAQPALAGAPKRPVETSRPGPTVLPGHACVPGRAAAQAGRACCSKHPSRGLQKLQQVTGAMKPHPHDQICPSADTAKL